MPLGRRELLSIGGGVVVTVMAGCSGDGSVDEIESGIEETNEHLEAVDPKLEAVASNIDEQNWEGCFSEVESIRGDLDAARQAATGALDLAEEEGHADHAAVLEAELEYIDILDQMADEAELACEAGQNGNGQELERRWTTLQDLDDQRHEKRSEIEDALNDLR